MGFGPGRELPSFPEEIILELTLAKGYGLEPGCSCVYVCMRVNVACMCIHGCVLGGGMNFSRGPAWAKLQKLSKAGHRGELHSPVCLPRLWLL